MLNDSISNFDSKVALTTIDNPYDPFTQFSDWFFFDSQKGYNSLSYLARIALVSDALSEEEYDDEKERAIDEIIQYDFMHTYKKVYNTSKEVIGI